MNWQSTSSNPASRSQASDEEGLPVLAAHEDRVVGWLTRRLLLRAYRRRIQSG